MRTKATGRAERPASSGFYRKLSILTVGGAAAFWAANFVTSLLPIAAEYRAALSIAYVHMVLVESLLGGLVIGGCVSYCLIRFHDRIPGNRPILKAEILSVIALVVAIIVFQGGASMLHPGDGGRYFLIGALLNVPRFLVLGLLVGYVYERLYGTA
jgi:hypothetical protein